MPANRRRGWTAIIVAVVIGLAVLSLTAAAQAAEAAQLNIDVGALAMKAVNVIATGLLALLVAAARSIAKAMNDFKTEVRGKFTGLEGSINGLTTEMQTVNQELFGVTGTNGMRGDLKKTVEKVDAHDGILIRLSERAGMAIRDGERR